LNRFSAAQARQTEIVWLFHVILLKLEIIAGKWNPPVDPTT
jgi:hypothetical protein